MVPQLAAAGEAGQDVSCSFACPTTEANRGKNPNVINRVPS
jgi:hypothetical protein